MSTPSHITGIECVVVNAGLAVDLVEGRVDVGHVVKPNDDAEILDITARR